MKSADVTADILYVLSDGRIHSMQEIADEVEICRATVQRHINALSYRYPINIVKRRGDKQGVQLDTTKTIAGKAVTTDKLQIIVKALELLQSSGCDDVDGEVLSELIRDFATPTYLNKEDRNAIQNRITKTGTRPKEYYEERFGKGTR